MSAALPVWADALVAVLVLAGAGVALLGSTGLLRLPTFFERIHAPAIIATLGCWCMTAATVVFYSVQEGTLSVFALLIAALIAITVPIPTIFLMRAALFRARQAGHDVPPNLSRDPPSAKDS